MRSLSDLKEMIEGRLEELSSFSTSSFSSLFEGAKYMLCSTGKRIRPLLVLSTVEMLDSRHTEAALDAACALEIVHTYSLIHDDLPCMDDDDFRRGKPTLHKVYDEGHAVLVGDYLLTRAFQVIAEAPMVNTAQKVELVTTLSKRAGAEGMVGGQIMDIEASVDIEEMNQRKTGALFCAAMEFAAILCQTDLNQRKQLSHFGFLLGQLFQIVDDVLDQDGREGTSAAITKLQTLFCLCFDSLQDFSGPKIGLQELIFSVVYQVQTQDSSRGALV